MVATNGVMRTRVFLVEDEPAVRRGLELLLNREPDLEVCGHAARQSDALAQILASKPDLAILDIRLEEGGGLDLVKELRRFGATLKLIVFSMHAQSSQVRAALSAGANGYVTKEEGSENLIQAIRTVLEGKPFLTEAVAHKLAKEDLNSGARDSKHT